jgi:hypothetical protein
MKRIGLILTIAGTILFGVMVWDLFGNKLWPVELTVPGMLMGISSMFLGPAFYAFTFSEARRKKITKRAFIFSISLIIVGLISAKLQITGARVEVMLGVLIICFFYGALSFKSKYEKWQIYARSKYDALFLSLFDFIGIGSLFLGFLFKIQHWPLSELLTTIGLITLAIGVLAWNQKFKKEVVFRKEAEDKLKESLDKIASQHRSLEEKQKEIIDSITYARRIQKSLLPTEKYIENTINRLNKR